MTEYDKYMDYFSLNEEIKMIIKCYRFSKDAEGNINLIKIPICILCLIILRWVMCRM